jgi:predicted amidohydrolase
MAEEQVILLPEMLTCGYHGDYNPRAYYDDEEIVEMLVEQGWIDCPICLAGIVGITE